MKVYQLGLGKGGPNVHRSLYVKEEWVIKSIVFDPDTDPGYPRVVLSRIGEVGTGLQRYMQVRVGGENKNRVGLFGPYAALPRNSILCFGRAAIAMGVGLS